MIKLSLKHPSGLEVSFEGEADTLDQVIALLKAELPDALKGLEPGSAPPRTGDKGSDGKPPPRPQGGPGPGTPLDPLSLAEEFERVGAKTDIERITVIAQAAKDSIGREGLDYDTADQVYLELGLKRPSQWRSTFSNARTRGYLRNTGRNVWVTTVMGENFALLGERGPARKRRRNGGGGHD